MIVAVLTLVAWVGAGLAVVFALVCFVLLAVARRRDREPLAQARRVLGKSDEQRECEAARGRAIRRMLLSGSPRRRRGAERAA